MTISLADNVQTFDMGEFSLDNSASKSSSHLPQAFTGLGANDGGEKMDKAVAKQTFKEVLKTTAKKSEEQITEHQELVIMLSRYGQSKRFAEYLKSMGFQLSVSQLKPLDNAELQELLQRVKTSIDNKNVSCFWEELVFGVIQTGEVIACGTRLSERLKVSGLTDALRGDDTFLDLIEQVELENQNLVYTSPYVRLVYSIATSAMKVHSINTMMEKRMKLMNPEETKTETKEETKEDLSPPDEPSKNEAQKVETKLHRSCPVLNFE